MVSVIGVVGPIGSGKDTIADYIAKKYGYTIFSFREIIRELMEKAGIEPNRENMQSFAREQRDAHGEEVFSKAVLDKILETKFEKALVREIRTSGDLKPIWNHFKSHMKIIKVVAPAELRFERMKSRQRIGDPQTLGEFTKQDKKEEELGYTKSFNFADFVIFNTSSREELYKQIDETMKKLDENKSLFRRKLI